MNNGLLSGRKPKRKPPRSVPEFTLDDVVMAMCLDMEARALSFETIGIYRQVLGYFLAWLAERGHSLAFGDITADDVQGYIRHCLTTVRPMTADLRYRSLRAVFNWAVKHAWCEKSPMAGMDRPKVPQQPKAIFTNEELAALVGACKGSTFEQVRDTAILRVFISTGARLGEVTGLLAADVDIGRRVAAVRGKTGSRRVRLGPKTAAALHRYLILRHHHEWRDSKGLWLGQKGVLSRIGVIQVVNRLSAKSGVDANPHRFRHNWAAAFRMKGGSVVDLETLGGWSPGSPMTRHYGSIVLAEEALLHADALGIGEDV